MPELDLNNLEDLKKTVAVVKTKSFGLFCWNVSEPLKWITAISKGGYVPGEKISLIIKIDNQSDVSMESVIVALKEKLTFGNEKHNVSLKRTLDQKRLQNRVYPLQSKIIRTELFLDPNHQYKLIDDCGYIHADYYIETKVRYSGFHFDSKNKMRIIIGTKKIPDDETFSGNSIGESLRKFK